MIDKTGTLDFFKDRIKELEAENAALKMDISKHVTLYNTALDLAERKADQLLKAQHRIKELREALEIVRNSMTGGGYEYSVMTQALATPDNTAEIDALVKDAERLKALPDVAVSILIGIDKTETADENGWWETSLGAEFGARKLSELLTAMKEQSK